MKSFRIKYYDIYILIVSAVSEIMSIKKPITLKSNSGKTIRDVSLAMKENKVSSVIVVDSADNPEGIITERDILRAIVDHNKSFDLLTVNEIMSSPVVTIMAYDSIDSAVELMKQRKIKRLIVLEESKQIVGVLSVTDIAYRLSKILIDDYNRFRSLREVVEQ